MGERWWVLVPEHPQNEKQDLMMINAHNLLMGCFSIFYLHKAFRL